MGDVDYKFGSIRANESPQDLSWKLYEDANSKRKQVKSALPKVEMDLNREVEEILDHKSVRKSKQNIMWVTLSNGEGS